MRTDPLYNGAAKRPRRPGLVTIIGTLAALVGVAVALWLAGAPQWGILSTEFILIALNVRVRWE